MSKESNKRPSTAVELREKENIRVAKGFVAWQEKRAKRRINNKTIPREYIEGNSNPSLSSNNIDNPPLSMKRQFIHEDELHTIIQKFNQVMDKLTNNVEKNKGVLDKLLEEHQANIVRMKSLSANYKDVEVKNNHFIKQQEYFETFFVTAQEDVLQRVLPGYKSKSQEETIFDFNEEEYVDDEIPEDECNKNSIINPTDLSKEELQKLMKEKLESFNNKKAEVDYRLRQNKELNDKLNTYMKSEYSIKTCNFCKQQYSPFCNTKSSCTYHLGKLRYVQCRGCGKDEYYTCCLKCKACQPGCRTGPHSPIN